MTNLRPIVDSILVPHTAFEVGMQRLQQCVEYVHSGAREPACIAVEGESRAGKSRLLEAHMARFQRERLADGLRVPMLCAVVPSQPTVKGLAELLLQALGVPDWDKGTENVKTARLVKLMRSCGVAMLILDEFQHFYDKSSHRVQHHVADWLKNLVGETRVALTVCGLPTLRAVIEQNEQLAGRFAAPIHLPRFDWFNAEHRAEWVAILAAFAEGLAREFDLPPLDGDELALRSYCATGGLIGYLTKTLRQAVWNALDAQTRVITVADLRRAHETAVWSQDRFAHLPSPFDVDLPVYPAKDVIDQAKLVGTAVLPAPLPRTPRARGRGRGTVGSRPVL